MHPQFPSHTGLTSKGRVIDKDPIGLIIILEDTTKGAGYGCLPIPTVKLHFAVVVVAANTYKDRNKISNVTIFILNYQIKSKK